MASGGGYLFLGGAEGVYKYNLEPYLQRLLKHAHTRIKKAESEDLDTTTAKKFFQTAQSNIENKDHLNFLVNIQRASRSAREARIIESDITPNERRLERNQMEKDQAKITGTADNDEDEMMSKLVQLAEMHESGILSEEEFLMAKAKLLKL